ncbi:AP-4 complex accessory subunit tepsin isoform X5 [Bubalus bubalis]|uniref:AP-4 complex accessory subunit tepsin isoform X5 n=1 Tax=Bubalus bubalis TaxID=89462 RepID=UPI001D0FE46F|nr:AP-4 complex accessory subunit tepsin isoform X5 [Bubalus bubalis]
MIGGGPGLAEAGRGRKVAGTMAATPPLRDRLSFLHRLPILLKGTSDDDVPCPGYLFEEIANLPRIPGQQPVSPGVLAEPSAQRLWPREAQGAEDPAAPVWSRLLFLSAHPEAQPCLHPGSCGFRGAPGSSPREQLVPEGAGGCPGSAGEAFLSTIQKAAEVVASAVRPGPESPSCQRSLLRGDAYQPAVTPSTSLGTHASGSSLPAASPGARAARHQPGQAGGGWDELDSSPSSQDSSQENDDLGKASDSGSRSGSDSPSGASRAPSDLAESRVEAVTLSDCQQELSLVRTVTQGQHTFLSREEVQHFVKECGLLNCEAVLELLIRHLAATSEHVQMRALGAIASLGCTDLLSQERVLLLTRPRLQELSAGSPGPVTNKATKILRHFEASCRQWPPARRPPAEPGPAAAHVDPSDLLTDTLPFTGGPAFLQPLSSALFLPKGSTPPSGLQPSPVPPTSLDSCPLPVPGAAREAETGLAGSTDQGVASEQGPLCMDTPKGGPEIGLGPSHSCSSLFAGMELVACPRLVGAGTAAEEPLPAHQAPWTLSQRLAAKEPSGSEPSAFAFLNS